MFGRNPEDHACTDALQRFDTSPESEPLASADVRRRDFLEALGEAVNGLPPLQAKIMQGSRSGPAVLHVVNPDAAHMTEDIGCEPQDSGEFWFTWSWGNTLGPADDPAGVAAAILRVLTPHRRP
jgi:hypothetical protein